MAGLNRIGSPMDICDEGFDEAPAVIEKRKRDLQKKQTVKSPFLIGTIEDINLKIGKLEQRLQEYTQLVVESRASDFPDSVDSAPISSFGRYHEREKENREVCRFAGIYTLKSTFLPNLSNRVRHISKISMQPAKEKSKKKDDPGKPKFVELYQFPGYDPVELTPLPGYEATEILQIVEDASVHISKKPQYQPEFQRLFFSPMSQAVLKDMFWYLFLDKFHPNLTTQQKLFNRTAHNYVKLIFYAKDPMFRDRFFKDYPRLMAQAVYAAFCHGFPDSYRQFGENFKNDLVFLVFGWIAGIQPTPRYWLDWNFSKLEPASIKLREELVNTNKKKQAQAMSFNFDYLDTLVPSNPSQHCYSVSQDASKSSVGSSWDKRKHRRTMKVAKSNLSPETQTQGSDVVQATLRAGKKSVTGESMLGSQSNSQAEDTPLSQKSKDGGDGLSTIRELEENTSAQEKKDSQRSTSGIFSRVKDISTEMKSHPACKGPDFLKSGFNLHGRSPLVAHFLRMQNISSDLNVVTRIQHTQIDNLPPLDAPTYADVIRESSKTVGTIEKMFQDMYTKNQKELTLFLNQQAAAMVEHRKRENILLSKKPEVKRLSELIILEQKKGLESISAGARAAVESALMATEL